MFEEEVSIKINEQKLTKSSAKVTIDQHTYRLRFTAHLKVDGFVVGIHACLLESFTECWMCVTCSCQIFRACSILNGDDSLRNHFTSIGSQDMSAKDSIGVFLGQDLDKTFRTTIGSCSGIC